MTKMTSGHTTYDHDFGVRNVATRNVTTKKSGHEKSGHEHLRHKPKYRVMAEQKLKAVLFPILLKKCWVAITSGSGQGGINNFCVPNFVDFSLH